MKQIVDHGLARIGTERPGVPPLLNCVGQQYNRQVRSLRGGLSTAAIGMLLLISAGCSASRPEGSAIIVATANSPADLDPRVALDEASQKADQLLFNSLVNVDADLQVTPELAESLEHPDAQTYLA